jgi:hypothetical protein
MRPHYACKRAYLSNNLMPFLQKNAEYVGEAKFTDFILRFQRQKPDTDIDLRWVREMHKNVWQTMNNGKFYPFHKCNIQWQDGFQLFDMSLGSPLQECSTLAQAIALFNEPLQEWFSFTRVTQEYLFGNISIYVETIDRVGVTVDVVCKTESKSLAENMRTVNLFLKQQKLEKTIPHQAATLVREALHC